MYFDYSYTFNDGVSVKRWSVEDIHVKPLLGKVTARLLCYISEEVRAAGKDFYKEIYITFDMDFTNPLIPPVFALMGTRASTALDLYFNPPAQLDPVL